jgi:DNA-binding IclR family transcriptional regulator
VQSSGVATTRGIFVHGSAALAAPVFFADGQPVLVMGLIAQIVDLPEAAVPEAEAELLAATQAASSQLGFTR